MRPQKHFDSLFAPVKEPSAATLAQAGVFVALRELEAAKSAGGLAEARPSAWSNSSLAGYRVGGNATSFTRTIKFTEPAGKVATEAREATVTVSAPNDSTFNVQVTDYAGQRTEFPVVRPQASHQDGTTSISTLLGEQLSLVDIVAQNPISASVPGEKLTLFNTGENFVGSVDVLPPSWMSLVGGNQSAASGSAKAPMRECPGTQG